MEKLLPRSLTPLRKSVIRVIGESESGLTNDQMTALIEGEDRPTIAKCVSNLKQKDFIDGEQIIGIGTVYTLTKYGTIVYKNLDGIMDKSYASNPGPRRKNPPPAPPQPPAPQPIQANISMTANNIADQITMLLDENAGYRDLLLQIVHTITKTLNLDMEIRNNGNSETDRH